MPMAAGEEEEEREDRQRGIFGRSMLKERGLLGMGFMELVFFAGTRVSQMPIVFVSVQH